MLPSAESNNLRNSAHIATSFQLLEAPLAHNESTSWSAKDMKERGGQAIYTQQNIELFSSPFGHH